MSNQQQQSGGVRQSVGQFIWVCQCIAYQGEAWWRKPGTAGSRYFSGQAVIGYCICLVVAAFSHSPELMTCWLGTGAVFLLHKVAGAIKRRRGKVPHSRYVGDSYLKLLGGNSVAVRFLEPLVTFLAGLAIIHYGHGYGGTIVVLSCCMLFSASYSANAEKAAVTQMQDAKAEQAWMMEQMRNN